MSLTAPPPLGIEHPSLPATHYVDNRIYTDPTIFAEEQERLFRRTWSFVCLASEVARPGDFRTTTVADVPLVVVRDQAGVLHAFVNACRHRGMPVVRDPAGRCAGFQCIYHLWTYGLDGHLEGIPYPEGYRAVGLRKEELGLVPVRVEAACGLVFVCLDPTTEPLRDYLGDALAFLEQPLGERELEVFHYLVSEIRTNWKLRTDNTRDYYHTLMHAFNRKTSRRDGRSPYRWSVLRNGHAVFSAWDALDASYETAYDRAGFAARDTHRFPGLRTNEWVLAAIFPNLAINVRTTACRLDRVVPLAPGRMLLETRGIGLKDDTPEVRAARIRDYNVLWGPVGRNQPEDVVAWEGQWDCFNRGGARYSIFAREEDGAPFDEESVRTFYRTWERWVGRRAAAPEEPAAASSPAQPPASARGRKRARPAAAGAGGASRHG